MWNTRNIPRGIGEGNKLLKNSLYINILCAGCFCGAPSGARFLRVKVPNPPGSGKDIAEGKGVHREVESEGSWM